MNNQNTNTTFIRNIIMICLGVITVLAILFGISRNVFGYFGGQNGLFAKTGKVVSNEMTFSEEINAIKIDINLGEVSIVPGDELKVSYSMPEKLVPAISVKDGALNIISSEKSVHVNFGQNNNQEYMINIVVPKNMKIEDINLDVDLGSIKLVGIATQSIEVVANLGEILMDNLTAKDVKVAGDAGNIELSNINASTIETSANMGDVVVAGSFDTLIASCDMGEINVSTDKPENEVSLRLNVDLGSITVNGHKW